MKLSLLLLALLILVGSALPTDHLGWVAPTADEIIYDTLNGLQKDSINWKIAPTTDVIIIQVIPDSSALVVATDSLTGWARTCTRPASLHRGGSVESVNFIKSDGTQTALLNWTPGEIYTIAWEPTPGGYLQLILQGSAGDTIPIQVIKQETDNQ